MPRRDFTAVRDKFARDNGLPFGRLLSREYVLSVLEGHLFRNRTFCPLVVLWGWLSQCLSQDKSLNEAVSRILAHRVATGLPACSANSASYSNARQKFPESVMRRMAREIGEQVHRKADGSWNWNGREVFLVDGTTFSMPDTAENQREYPKSDPNYPLGFPMMRAVALVSLATGAVMDIEFGKYAGKGSGEISLFSKVGQTLPIGSIVVADRYYPTYATMAGLKARGIDVVSVSHAHRGVDFSAGRVLGPKDHIVEWTKGQVRNRVSNEAAAAYADLPETVMVREFAIEIDGRSGREELIVVTTMSDPTLAQQEISDLYWQRWNCELDIRSIKHSLQMDVLRAKTPEMVRKEIWAHLLAYNLLRGTMVESAKRNAVVPRQLSVKGAMQAVESFTPAMMATDSETLYDALLTTVSAHRVGNRPGRQEPRAKKRRPAWKVYMKRPRREFRRKLAREAISLS